jgi:hypothetical protein
MAAAYATDPNVKAAMLEQKFQREEAFLGIDPGRLKLGSELCDLVHDTGHLGARPA